MPELPKATAFAPFLLILSASGMLQAQTFNNVDYLYRATSEAKPQNVLGRLTLDPAKKIVVFNQCQKYWSDCDPQPLKPNKSKKPLVLLEIPANTVTHFTYRSTTPVTLVRTSKTSLFLTFQYTTDSGDHKYAVFKLMVNELGFQDALAAVEATLGKQIVRGGG